MNTSYNFKKRAEKAEAFLLTIRDNLGSEVPIQTAQVFLVVASASDNGIAVADIRKHIRMSQATASRNLAYLGKVHRQGKPGLNLVVLREDPFERRRKLAYLTDKGKQVASRVTTAYM